MSAELPDGLVMYAETSVFTEKTVPGKLTSVHDTKQGVWGKLVVKEGMLHYILMGPPEARMLLHAGDHAIIEPQVKHRVELAGPAVFQVEFYKRPDEKPTLSTS